MTVADGKLLTLNLLLKAWGIPIRVEGTIESVGYPSRPQAPEPEGSMTKPEPIFPTPMRRDRQPTWWRRLWTRATNH